MKSRIALSCLVAAMAFQANAAEILVSGDITTSVTWTADNVYNLQGQVFVMPGATITIQPGTIIASSAGGSLAITRGARIDCEGTASAPIIFTSKADYNTWTATHPRGQWRAACNEWGNLTIMGRGFIGKYGNGAPAGNTAAPSASNYALMEGLTPAGPTDERTRYGGGNDQDDSGSLRYTSLRYGGLVVGLTNELNGLSLGGVGQETQIDHIEIMNNVDDGIELWGGKVDLRYFSIWNIGDDSFDVDHGYRGRCQFGLIVQGYSVNAAAGSGVCDSMIEIDGAAKSDAQPVSTVAMYNMTLIGQPLSVKRALKFRDNARLQINNSIIMEVGEAVVRNDNSDNEATDGQTGYGYNGTLTFAQTWTTDFNVYSVVNPFTTNPTPAEAYSSLDGGKLSQLRDTVFYNNLHSAAYTQANTLNVFASANDNVIATQLPIAGITRGPTQILTGVSIQPVIGLDPRAANAALVGVVPPPPNGFYVPVTYRGAFGPNENWLCGWSAASQYGYTQSTGCVSPCPPDLDADRMVGGSDLTIMLGAWGASGAADLNFSGTVEGADLTILLGAWGSCD
jgi:hypothetical protein